MSSKVLYFLAILWCILFNVEAKTKTSNQKKFPPVESVETQIKSENRVSSNKDENISEIENNFVQTSAKDLKSEQIRKKDDSIFTDSTDDVRSSGTSPDDCPPGVSSEHGLIHHDEPRKWNLHSVNKREKAHQDSPFHPNPNFAEMYPYLALRHVLQHSHPLILNQNQVSPLQSINHLEKQLQEELLKKNQGSQNIHAGFGALPMNTLPQAVHGGSYPRDGNPHLHHNSIPGTMNMIVSQPIRVANYPNHIEHMPRNYMPQSFNNNPNAVKHDIPVIHKQLQDHHSNIHQVNHSPSEFHMNPGQQQDQRLIQNNAGHQHPNHELPVRTIPQLLPILKYASINRYPLVNETPQNKHPNPQTNLLPGNFLTNPVYHPFNSIHQLLPMHQYNRMFQQYQNQSPISQSGLVQGLQLIPHIVHNQQVSGLGGRPDNQLFAHPQLMQQHIAPPPYRHSDIYQYLMNGGLNSPQSNLESHYANLQNANQNPIISNTERYHPHQVMRDAEVVHHTSPNAHVDQQPHPVYHHDHRSNDNSHSGHPVRNVQPDQPERHQDFRYGQQADHHASHLQQVEPEEHAHHENHGENHHENEEKRGSFYEPVQSQQRNRSLKRKRGQLKRNRNEIQDAVSNYSM